MRILIDVTQTVENPIMSGIPRVVTRLAQELLTGETTHEIILVKTFRLNSKLLIRAKLSELERKDEREKSPSEHLIRFGSKLHQRLESSKLPPIFRGRLVRAAMRVGRNVALSLLSLWEVTILGLKLGKPKKVSIRRGDIVFFPDVFWNDNRALRLAQMALRKSCRNVVLLNDVIPFSHPEFFHAEDVRNFQSRVSKILALADGALFPSEATKAETNKYLGNIIEDKPQFRIPYGFDFNDKTKQNMSTELEPPTRLEGSICAVGTVEPRKNYDTLVDWFLEFAGAEHQLTIIGRPGWQTLDLQEKMRSLTMVNINFSWIEDADDEVVSAELAKHEIGVLGSFAEGYGLPIVEMSQAGLKLVLSDISAFREVAGDAAVYFDPKDTASLMDAINRAKSMTRAPHLEKTTWSSSASRVLEILVSLREK